MDGTSRQSILPSAHVSTNSILLVGIIGLVVGAATWLLSLFLQATVVEPLFCRSADSFGVCANGGTIAITAAAIVANIGGLYLLVRRDVYRPLLVVLASIVTLYGVNTWLGSLAWFEASLWYGLITGVTYALYMWIARITSFIPALTATVVVAVILRLIMHQL